jgi:transcriptional regulator with XRE-family HTH domain|tara:strand:+ start:464 stop:853 length:390 start_codon:yes stop_codon:yes gene_type:complete
MKIIKTKDYNTFCQMAGANLRYCRNSKNLTQRAIGEKINITHQQIQKYEQGVSCCSAYRLDQMAKIYEVPVGDLLDPDFISNRCNKKHLTPQDAGYLKPQKDIGSLEEIKAKLNKDGIDWRDTILPAGQ